MEKAVTKKKTAEIIPFNDMFDGKWRKVVPMGIGDPMALEVATQLRKEGYTIVNKMETVKQRLKIASTMMVL